MSKILLSRHWSVQVTRIVIIVFIAWWLLGSPNLLAQFGLVEEWPNTDFDKHSVPLSEIISGGPGKDGIPAIDKPEFLRASHDIDWLDDSEPVIALIVPGHNGGQVAKAYPIQILIWHEIVNDEIAGRPVVVTFCPLCNASLVFDRRLDGKILDFGTTGRLRKSDLVMYDRQTESWWQQFLGEAIVGDLTGKKLDLIASRIMSWADFRQSWPEGMVLSKDTGFYRSYGINPYQGYDDINQTPFLLDETPDPRLSPMERIAVLRAGHGYRAYPYSTLEKAGVLHDMIDGKPIVFFTKKNTRSALDRRLISESRLIISAQAFDPVVNGQQLEFYTGMDGKILDRQSNTIWSLSGQAEEGLFKGQRLREIHTDTHFAFAWLTFRPNTGIYGK
jgi:hypothetical protein